MMGSQALAAFVSEIVGWVWLTASPVGPNQGQMTKSQ
jgi:hypothetical protein